MVTAADMPLDTMDELAFTQEELTELERARSMPIAFDEDCPETTPERAMKFRRVNPARHNELINSTILSSLSLCKRWCNPRGKVQRQLPV